jgi:hypothetical protein
MSQRQSEDLHDLRETIGQLEAEIRNLSSELTQYWTRLKWQRGTHNEGECKRVRV